MVIVGGFVVLPQAGPLCCLPVCPDGLPCDVLVLILCLGLDYQQLKDKFKRGELKNNIAGWNSKTGRDNGWRDGP